MRNILSKHDLRQLILLELLVKNKQNWLLLKDISKHLKIPIRTIHSDIKEISIYIHPIYIKSSSFGVKIVMPQTYSEKYIYRKILEESREFKILEYIFVNGNENVESLSDKLYLSESTIKRMIKEMNRVLNREGFSIQGKPLALTGNGQKLIHFMSTYFSERYILREEYMSLHQKKLIDTLVTSILSKTGKEMNFPNLKRISTRVFLSCLYLKNYHSISIPNSKKQFTNEILNNEDFCSEFFEVFSIELSDDVIKQIFNIYSGANYAFNMEELNRLVKDDYEQRNLYYKIKKALNILSAQFDLPMDQNIENKLLLDIINIINMKPISEGFTFILYNRREYFLSDLFAYSSKVRAVVQNILKETLSLEFNENEWNEINYILLTHWTEFYYKIRFIETPIKVFLFIDTDIEHGQLIKSELETYSRYNIRVENIINYSELQLKAVSYDNILVTNVPALLEINCHILCFGEFLNSRDWQEFERLIESIRSQLRKS